MESRLIYSASMRLKNLVNWDKSSETEWIYCGSTGEVNLEIVLKNLTGFLTGSKFYVAIDRRNSFVTLKNDLFISIKDKIGLGDFLVWSEDFHKAIEFNKIGVFRKGTCEAQVGLPLTEREY